MLPTLLLILPLGVGSAVSPVMLTEQTVLLSVGGEGRAVRYAAGVILTALLIVSGFVVFGRAISLPTEPSLDASLDIVLGLALLVAAYLVWALGRRKRPPKSRDALKASFPLGVFSMATNVTTIALIAPAAKEISTADVGFVGRGVLVAVLIGLISLPAWLPVVLVKAAPEPGRRVLDTLRRLIDRYCRTAIITVLGAAGLFFVARGVVRLLT